MTIEKLPSGSYRIRQQYNGKRYSVTLDHKPTNKEALKLISEMVSNAPATHLKADRGTLLSYMQKYLTECEETHKSPSTIRGYQSIVRNLPEWLLDKKLNDITADDLQKYVDEYAKTHSPKSTRSSYSLVRIVVGNLKPQIVQTIKLPPMAKQSEYEPSTDDIKRILEYSKSSRYYLFLRLSAIGLRRGEIGCLTAADISDQNVLTINKDLVLDAENNYIIKDCPKTDASNRRILIPEDIAEDIRKKGYVFKGNLHTVNEYLHKCQDKLGIPRFRLHIMRHFAAAYLLKKNQFTTQQVEDYMGWEHGSEIMRKVYAYNLDPEESQKEIVNAFNELF